MRTITTILFLFLTVSVFGQLPTTDLTFHWDGQINSSDSTLINELTGTADANFKILNFQGSTSDTYISAKSTAKLKVYGDTIPITCLFSNYNYADTLYFLMDDHTINADSTELYPYRLSEIAYYSVSKSGADSITLDSYFSVPRYPTAPRTVGVGKDYADIQLAYTAASAGDTILVFTSESINSFSATYDFFFAKSITIIGVGDAEISSSGGTYLLANQANFPVTINKVDVNAIGSAWGIRGNDNITLTDVYGVRGSTSFGLAYKIATVENCVISGDASYSFVAGGNNTTIKDRYSYYNGTVTSHYATFSKRTGSTLLATGSKYDMAYSGFKYWSQLNFDGTGTVRACDFTTGVIPALTYDTDYDFSMIACTFDSLSTLVAESKRDFTLTVDECTINNADTAGSIFLLSQIGNISITNNTIATKFKYIFLSNTGLSDTAIISNNDLSMTESSGYGEAYGIGIIDLPDTLDTYIEISENILKTEPYFSQDSSNIHAGFFLEQKNIKTYRNVIYECNTAGILYKGKSFKNTSAICQGNILIGTNLYNKGMDSVFYYGNTVYSANNEACMYVLPNGDDAPTYYPSYSTTIKNNIFVSDTYGIPPIYFNDITQDTAIVCNYNLFYNTLSDTIGRIGSNYYTSLASWQAQGYDTRSFYSNPNFASTTNLWALSPSDVFNKGLGLGDIYKTGLDITSSWPSSMVTKDQDGAWWDIGAYVQNLTTTEFIEPDIYIVNGDTTRLIETKTNFAYPDTTASDALWRTTYTFEGAGSIPFGFHINSGTFAIAEAASVLDQANGKYINCTGNGSIQINLGTTDTDKDAVIYFYDGSWTKHTGTLASLISAQSWLSLSGKNLVFTMTSGQYLGHVLIKNGTQ